MHNYFLEFILSTHGVSEQSLRKTLAELGAGLEIITMPQDDAERGEHFKIQISTPDPTIIFDTCAQFGRIKSVKVEEVK